jgi:hypothetical protein
MPEMLTVNFKTLCERNHYQNLLDNFDFKNESIEKFLNDDRFLQNYVNIGMSESKRNLLGLLCLMNTDNSKYIQTLLSKANPELLKSSILRATYEAIKTQNIETLKLLLDYTMSLFGTYKNFESSNESLLLFHAIFYNYLEKLKLLVDYGADIHATWYGDTMLEVARRHGRTEILTYLEKLY